jgi:hypothetical protein
VHYRSYKQLWHTTRKAQSLSREAAVLPGMHARVRGKHAAIFCNRRLRKKALTIISNLNSELLCSATHTAILCGDRQVMPSLSPTTVPETC